jgi:hypothetical protein
MFPHFTTDGVVSTPFVGGDPTILSDVALQVTMNPVCGMVYYTPARSYYRYWDFGLKLI